MTRLKTYRRLYGALLALAGFALVATAVVRVQERSDEIAAASRVVSDYASVVAEQIEASAYAVDLSLKEIAAHHVDVESLEAYLASATSRQFYDRIVDIQKHLPQVDVITATDADGRMIASTRGFPHREVDLSDRDYFIHLKNTADPGVFISRPVNSRVTGATTVYFARRLQTAAGEFLGVVIIGVRPEVLIQTHHALSNIEGQTFVLLRRDGVVFMRKPDQRDRAGDGMPAQSDWYRAVAEGGGLYRSPGWFDSEARYVAVRPLAHYPLVLDVATTEKAALAAWSRRTKLVLTMMAIGVFIMIAFTLLLRRQHVLMEASDEHLREREQELAETNQRLEAALDNMSHGLAMFDLDGRLVVANRLFGEMYGVRPAQLRPGLTIVEILDMRIAAGVHACGSPESYRALAGAVGSIDRLDYLCDGRVIAVKRLMIAESGAWLTTHEDVTERVRGSERIQYLAMHDALTGLANRTRFISRLTEIVEGSGIDHTALLLVDLDGFKGVNDSFGHGVGDELLRQLAHRLCAWAPFDLVARLGGDEFAILHTCADDPEEEAVQLAEALTREVERPFLIGPRKLAVTLSVGIAILDADVRDVERLMRWADLALYRAKREGRNRHRTFVSSMETEFQAKADLAEELRVALDTGCLDVFYQPIVDAATTEVRTMEALVRWRHPTRGMVPPNIFVPLAEEAGLVGALGDFVLRRACADALAWPENVTLAVNASPLQIAQGDFVSAATDALLSAGLCARRLEIEITESVLLRNDTHNLRVLHELRERGISVALDDFGTGYSSLSYLKLFPFDKLKIDKSFVDDVTHHAGCAAIIGATTMLARSFEITTCAEGVETEEQFVALRAAGLGLMQGYLFGRPAPIEDWAVADGRIVLPGRDDSPSKAA